MKEKVTFLGTGAYATAIAHVLSANKNIDIWMYGIDDREINDINKKHINSRYFGNKKLSLNIKATNSIEESIKGSKYIFVALPSTVIEDVLINKVIPSLNEPKTFINLSKGFNYSSVMTISKTIDKIVPKKYLLGTSVISGPGFANDIVNDAFTSLVISSKSNGIIKNLEKFFLANKKIVISKTNDIYGVEYSSIYKNVLALVLGVANGLNMSINSISIIFTNALKEIEILGNLIGIEKKTIFGYACVGDLFLTGTSMKSRNFSTGFEIGKTNKVTKNSLKLHKTIEGLNSPVFLRGICEKEGISLPLNELLYSILYEGVKPSVAFDKYFLNLLIK